MKVRLKLEGRKFGNLICQERLWPPSKYKVFKWKCLCVCGRTIDVSTERLLKGKKTDCGCLHNWRNFNVIGKKFGRLLVLGQYTIQKDVYCQCVCDCGINCSVLKSNLTRSYNKIVSCGCYRISLNSMVGAKLQEWRNKPENKEKLSKAQLKGPTHPWYNHGLSDENRQTRRYCWVSKEYRDWQKLVFSTDNYKCARCNLPNRKNKRTLCAHHILPWKWWPELRYDIKNGITLCNKCHNEYHSLYGKDDNCNHHTLMEFLGD